jgi:hypothetical protein
VKTYIEELLTTFSDFHQTVFSFLTAHSLQQLFPQLTVHSNFFHNHSPTKQTLCIDLDLDWLGPRPYQDIRADFLLFLDLEELPDPSSLLINNKYNNLMIETFWVQIHAKNVPDDKSKLLES